jgi:hypothetical protein
MRYLGDIERAEKGAEVWQVHSTPIRFGKPPSILRW